MRRVMVLAFIALLPNLAVGQNNETKAESRPANNIKTELEKLDDEAEEAARKGDGSFFEKYLADDYVGIGSTGNMGTKASTVEFVRSGKLKVGGWKINDRKIRVSGEMAVITPEEQYTDAYSGTTDISGAYRVTLVFVKLDNGLWKEVLWQATKEHASQPH
jgi:hypothetical protein